MNSITKVKTVSIRLVHSLSNCLRLENKHLNFNISEVKEEKCAITEKEYNKNRFLEDKAPITCLFKLLLRPFLI